MIYDGIFFVNTSQTKGAELLTLPQIKKAVVLCRKALNNRLLCCIIKSPQITYKKAR